MFAERKRREIAAFGHKFSRRSGLYFSARVERGARQGSDKIILAGLQLKESAPFRRQIQHVQHEFPTAAKAGDIYARTVEWAMRFHGIATTLVLSQADHHLGPLHREPAKAGF